MQSVALDQSTVYPNDDDEYVLVEFSSTPAEPSHTSPLLEGISDDEEDDEYDYCDDIENESSLPVHTSNIEQSISFEEVSDRLFSTSKFYFGEEADQLLLELDNSASLLHEVSENEEVSSSGGPLISSSPSHYDNAASDTSVENEEEKASMAKSILTHSNDRNYSHTHADLGETKKPAALTCGASAESASAADEKPQKKEREGKSEPPQLQHSSSSSVSRLTNKKRRKQMKLAKKAAAAAAAAASIGHLSTMGSHHSHHHSMGSDSSSHPSHREKTNATAVQAPSRGKNKKQVAPNSVAVACATQSLAEYRLELQSHHRNSPGTTTTTMTNKLVR